MMKKNPWLALALCLPLTACGGSEQHAEMPNPTTTDQSADDMALANNETPAEEAAPEIAAPPPQLVVHHAQLAIDGDHTAIEGATPTLTVQAPRNGSTVRRGDVMIRWTLRNWELSAQGSHVHVIVDNEPYIAVRSTDAINLTQLVRDNLGHELSEGTHVVRMYPSRGHHESVKDPGAFAIFTFNNHTATPDFAFDASAPLLTFSRPKGCNVTGSEVLLDFFVSNATLAPDAFRVRYTLDGVAGEITEWRPHHMQNLALGAHEIHLELLNAAGEPVPGMFNDTTRTFTVAEACTPPAPAGTPADPHAGH